MNTQIEKLKGKSIQFTMPMVLERLSEITMEDMIAENDKFQHEEILFRKVETKEDLRALKAYLNSIKTELSASLIDSCKEDLKEIADDLKWKSSKTGKAVLALEAWVINARTYFSTQPDFQFIFIGRDWNDPLVLIISGVVDDDVQLENLKKQVHMLNPPVEPVYIIDNADTV